MVFLIAGSFLTGLFESVMVIAVPLYASGLGFSIAEVGAIMGAGAAISIFGLIVLGRKMESLGKENSLIITMLLAGFSFLAMMFVSNLAGIAILTGIFITGRAGGLNVARAFISDNLHEDFMTTGMSISDMVQYVARIVGPLFAGLLIDLFAIQSVFISVFAFSLLGTGLLMAYKAKSA
jgi:MFS family permease